MMINNNLTIYLMLVSQFNNLDVIHSFTGLITCYVTF